MICADFGNGLPHSPFIAARTGKHLRRLGINNNDLALRVALDYPARLRGDVLQLTDCVAANRYLHRAHRLLRQAAMQGELT